MFHETREAYRRLVGLSESYGNTRTDIYEEWVPTTDEYGEPNGYWGLTTKPTGRLAATIVGQMTVVDDDGIRQWAIIDGRKWALRDAIRLARKGAYGLVDATGKQ